MPAVSVLFACTRNTLRSPMAAGLLRAMHRDLHVDSVGVAVDPDEPTDPFVIAVMAELGIDLARHHAKTFDDMVDGYCDVIVTLSPEAHERALEVTRTVDCAVEYWETPDPSQAGGNRAQRLDAYRTVRDGLAARIRARFPTDG